MARQRRSKAPQVSAPVVASAELVGDGLAVGLLAQRILDPSRTTSVVLVTTDVGQPQPYVPVAELAARAGDRAEIVVVPHQLTNVLADRLGRPFSAFRGACRVYPPGDGWRRDARLSPDYFKRGRPDRVRKLFNGNIRVDYFQYHGEKQKA